MWRVMALLFIDHIMITDFLGPPVTVALLNIEPLGSVVLGKYLGSHCDFGLISLTNDKPMC
jgi:hypothetical protein